MKKILQNLVLVVLLNFSAGASLCAVHDDVLFQRLSIEQGLSNAIVYGILQDRQGFMWFGTEDGLNRYDGYTFKVYKCEPNNPGSLSSPVVSSLYQDRHGFLWFSTRNKGITRFDPGTETFTHFQHDDQNPASLSSNYADISPIVEDDAGMIWIGTSGGGLNRFDPETQTFTHFRHKPADPNSLSNDLVQAIGLATSLDRKQLLWIGTNFGLNRFDPTTTSFTRYLHDESNPNSLVHNTVRVIYVDPAKNVIWLGTPAGLDRFDPETETFTHFQHDELNPNSLSHNNVRGIIADQDGTLWISTLGGGLNHFDPGSGRFTSYRNDPDNPFSLSDDAIHPIYRDRHGSLWIGTWSSGVNRIDPQRKKFRLFQCRNGLSHPTVYSIYPDRQGFVWIGTWGGGLNRFDPKAETFTHFQHRPADPQSLSHNAVSQIFEDRSGVLWVGTWGGGLNRFDRATETFTRYQYDPQDPQSLSDNSVRGIAEDARGRLWIGTTNGGVNRFDPSSGTFVRYPYDPQKPGLLSSRNVWHVLYDTQGVLWVGTGNGLNRMEPDAEHFQWFKHDAADPGSISNDTVTTMFEDHSGTLWIGTAMGLNRMDRASGRFQQYFEQDGLPGNRIESIAEDEQGHLWIGTTQGLSKFDPRTGVFRNYDAEDGLQSNVFYHYAAARSPDGRMYFGGLNGFSMFAPEEITDNPVIPPVRFTDFRILGQSVRVGEHSILRRGIDRTDSITLSHDQSVFTIEFSALNYTAPKKNRYAYQLQGFDKDWVQTDSSKRFAHYTNLDPGRYVFRVKGSNNDALWNDSGASVEIIILPPWWKTWWFHTTLIFLLLALVLGGHRYRLSALRARSRLLEQQVAERTKALSQEIGERKNAEEGLRKSQLLLNETGKMAKVGGWEFDVETLEQVWTEEVYRIHEVGLDYRPTVAKGIEFYAPECRPVIEQAVRRAIDTGEPFDLELQFVTAKGNHRWVHAAGHAHRENGRTTRVSGTIQDITERKQAEEERARLEAQNRQLQKAESLGRMAGAIAHHFNNQLGVVIGNLEMALSDLPADSIFRGNLDEAMRAALRSAETSGLMLTYLGQSVSKGGPLDLGEVCRRHLPQLQSSMPGGIVLETDLPAPGPIVRAGENQLSQVLTHLLTNARESIGEKNGRITLTTATMPASAIGGSHMAPTDWKPSAEMYACLQVSDTGCGMTGEDMDKIFDPFFTTKFTGRGLGLAVVLGIIKAWGGVITVEGQVDRGTTFRVFLPLVAQEVSVQPAKSADIEELEEVGTVLLVEDQDMVRRTAENMLTRLGYTVLAAADGNAALEIFRRHRHRIFCVITDLTMPGMNGWETLTALRRIEPQLPVVLASGYDEAQAMYGDHSEQPQAFLQKPYSMAQLKAVLRQILKQCANKGD